MAETNWAPLLLDLNPDGAWAPTTQVYPAGFAVGSLPGTPSRAFGSGVLNVGPLEGGAAAGDLWLKDTNSAGWEVLFPVAPLVGAETPPAVQPGMVARVTCQAMTTGSSNSAVVGENGSYLYAQFGAGNRDTFYFPTKDAWYSVELSVTAQDAADVFTGALAVRGLKQALKTPYLVIRDLVVEFTEPEGGGGGDPDPDPGDGGDPGPGHGRPTGGLLVDGAIERHYLGRRLHHMEFVAKAVTG